MNKEIKLFIKISLWFISAVVTILNISVGVAETNNLVWYVVSLVAFWCFIRFNNNVI